MSDEELDVPDVCWTNTGYKTEFTFCFEKALDYISLVTSKGWLYELETGKLQTVAIVLKHRVPKQTNITAALIIRCIECGLFEEARWCLSKYDGDREYIDCIAAQYGMVDDLEPRQSLVPSVFYGASRVHQQEGKPIQSLIHFKHFLKENLPDDGLLKNIYWWDPTNCLGVRPFKSDLFTHAFIHDKPKLLDQFVNFLLEAKETIEIAKELITDDSV